MVTADFDAFADPAPHDGIYRNGLDQPYVFAPDYKGEITFERGKSPKGRKGYARVTSFIDVLDDKTNLDIYHQRLVLIGLAKEPSLLVEAHESLQLGTVDDKIVKDALNHVAGKARQAADEDLKAARGTASHGWCEEADRMIAVGMSQTDILAALSPTQVVKEDHKTYTFELAMYVKDVEAYIALTRPLLRHLHIEQLCISDTLQTAGTPDRISEWVGPPTLVPASGGTYIQPGDVLIVDEKTGNVEYGVGKFAMQLGDYGNSVIYDQATNTRTPMPDRLRRDWGLIVHVPAGKGEASLIWVDINAGWDAAHNLAPRVRAWRNDGKKLAAKHPRAATVQEKLLAAFSVQEMRSIWSENQDVWTDEMQELATSRGKEFDAA